MDTVWDYQDFCEVPDTEQDGAGLRELCALAAQLRSRLGDEGYLLDSYFGLLLAAAKAMPLHAAAEQGFNVCRELRTLIRSLVDEEDLPADHPLYEQVKEYISGHPTPFRERYTVVSLYFAALSDNFTTYAVDRFAGCISGAVRGAADMVKINNLRSRICEGLDNDGELDRFDRLFRRQFLSVLPMAGFLQGIADNLITELMSGDEETSKPIYRLLLDANLESEE